MKNSVTFRAYRPEDLDEILQLFYDTVHTVNAKDYTPGQLDAWADGRADREAWDRSFREHDTLVALEGDRIVGFADMDGSVGYLDRLYIHKEYQGRGIASALCDRLEREHPQRNIRFTHPLRRGPSSKRGATPQFVSNGWSAMAYG